MSTMTIHGWLATGALAVLAAVSTPAAAGGKHAAPADPTVILEWNQVLQDTIPATAGVFSFRYYAMLHIAMFDAVNSVEPRYSRYRVRVHAHPAASAEAAAAQAARDVLVALIPAAQPTYDAALQQSLSGLHPTRAAYGAAVGSKVARAILQWRTGDGFERPNPPYTPPPLPGLWQPTAPGQVAAAVHFGDIKPFALLTSTQYLPAAPPLLNSARYANDLLQVQALGSVNSATRTAEQTLLARLFAGPPTYSPNPFALWSRVARDAALSHHLSLSETARLFAHVSAAMHDGIQTAHTSKYIYGLWRPVTAITRADEDANDLTFAEPGWTPLLGTPPYPSHASNLTCIGASAARVLTRSLGEDAKAFTVTWTGLGGAANVTRSYQTFSQLAEEGGLSRVYGGIHFLFEVEAAHTSCSKVGDYVFDNYMRPRGYH